MPSVLEDLRTPKAFAVRVMRPLLPKGQREKADKVLDQFLATMQRTEETGRAGGFAGGAGDFAGMLFLDPLTFVTIGASTLIRAGLQGAAKKFIFKGVEKKTAKTLLKQKGIQFTEFDVMLKPGRRQEMMQRAGGATSVPQIFIGETHVGGYDDMAALDARGELDPLLS